MIGIFGGTFDPIHFGHLRPALELQEQLGFAELRFVPAHVPPHREQPAAGPAQRLRMARLAVGKQAGFVVDDREIRRNGPSYTVHTLIELREEQGADTPLCLILGSDAFAEFTSWHHWREIQDLAHLVIARRPDSRLPEDGDIEELLVRARVDDPRELRRRPYGGVIVWPVSQLDISASAIRECIVAGRSARYLLPDPVWDYIQQQGLYGSGRSTSFE